MTTNNSNRNIRILNKINNEHIFNNILDLINFTNLNLLKFKMPIFNSKYLLLK